MTRRCAPRVAAVGRGRCVRHLGAVSRRHHPAGVRDVAAGPQFAAVSVGAAVRPCRRSPARSSGPRGVRYHGTSHRGRFVTRLVAAQLTLDESTAMSMAQDEPEAQRTAFWITGGCIYLWNLGTLLRPGSSVDPMARAPAASCLPLLAPARADRRRSGSACRWPSVATVRRWGCWSASRSSSARLGQQDAHHDDPCSPWRPGAPQLLGFFVLPRWAANGAWH